MSSIQNPYFVYVNSSNRLSGTDANFSYLIEFPSDKKFDRVLVLNALVPKSWYLVQNGRNTMTLMEDAKEVKIELPVGNYSLRNFQSVVSALLTANSPNTLTYTITYPSTQQPDTGKFTYAVDNGLIQCRLIFGDDLYEPFCFSSNSTNLFVNGSLTSTNVIKLQSEDRVILHSNCVNNCGRDDVLLSINASTTPMFSSINYECFTPEHHARVLNSQYNNVYNFAITDENGKSLDMNGLNMNFTLLFFKQDNISEVIKKYIGLIVK